MPKHAITRTIMAVVTAGFVIIFVAGTSSVKAGDKNQDLIKAALNGKLEEVQRLLNEGADVNAKEKRGVTALMDASWDNHLKVMKVLLDNGADVNVSDECLRSLPVCSATIAFLRLSGSSYLLEMSRIFLV